MAHTPPREPWSRLVIVRGSRANVRDQETRNRPGRTHSFLRRGLPLRADPAPDASTATPGQGSSASGFRRRPAEDGGVGAPPPAGRAERRQRLDLILNGAMDLPCKMLEAAPICQETVLYRHGKPALPEQPRDDKPWKIYSRRAPLSHLSSRATSGRGLRYSRRDSC